MNNNTDILTYYLSLQCRRVIRLLRDNGIYLWLAIPIAILGFTFLTFKLLKGFAFGELLYSAIGIGVSLSVMNQRQFDFIQTIAKKSDYRLIRIVEQFVVLVPFIIGLLIFQWYWVALLLFFVGVSLSYFKIDMVNSQSLPTPFSMRPFEFTRGFRGAILLIIGFYILVPIGLSVTNFNLAMSSMVGIGLVSGNYFIQPEPRYYIWIHAVTPRDFIIEKSKTIICYTLCSVTPIAIALVIYDPSRIMSIILMILAVTAFVEMCMLSKYQAYPSQINIVAGLAMGFSILFPPLMLIIIPVFYFKAIRRLNLLLR